jgi:hypothetical protein
MYKYVFTKKVKLEFVLENFMLPLETLDKQRDDNPDFTQVWPAKIGAN